MQGCQAVTAGVLAFLPRCSAAGGASESQGQRRKVRHGVDGGPGVKFAYEFARHDQRAKECADSFSETSDNVLPKISFSPVLDACHLPQAELIC